MAMKMMTAKASMTMQCNAALLYTLCRAKQFYFLNFRGSFCTSWATILAHKKKLCCLLPHVHIRSTCGAQEKVEKECLKWFRVSAQAIYTVCCMLVMLRCAVYERTLRKENGSLVDDSDNDMK